VRIKIARCPALRHGIAGILGAPCRPPEGAQLPYVSYAPIFGERVQRPLCNPRPIESASHTAGSVPTSEITDHRLLAA